MTDTADTHDQQPAEGRDKTSRWRGLKIALAVIVAVLVIIWLALWLYHRMTHVSGKDARVATNEITISSRLSGRVTGFTIMQGDRLQTGALIAQLYSKPDTLKLEQLRDRVASVQAQAAAQKAQISLAEQQLTGGVKQTKLMLDADSAAAQAAKARMQKAHNKAQRADKLYHVHGATEQQRDVTHYDYESAKADYEQAKRRLAVDEIALANARTGMLSGGLKSVPNPTVLNKKLDIMQSQLAEAKAALAHQRNRVDDLRIRSPINGVVDRTFIQQDEYVSAGQPILMMHDPGDVWIEAKLKETKIHSLKVGQQVVIHVDARPDTTYRGHVRVIGHAATNQFALLPDPNPSGNFTKITQRIPVRIAIDHGPRDQLSPGMMVEVDIDITQDSGKAQDNG